LDESKYMADMPALGAGISPVSYVNLISCKSFLIYICKNKVIESIKGLCLKGIFKSVNTLIDLQLNTIKNKYYTPSENDPNRNCKSSPPRWESSKMAV